MARVLTASGFTVIKVIRHNRQARRLKGKSDPLDAHQAAVSVPTGLNATVPKSADRHAEGTRILVSERRSAVKARSQAMNQIHACHRPRSRTHYLPGPSRRKPDQHPGQQQASARRVGAA